MATVSHVTLGDLSPFLPRKLQRNSRYDLEDLNSSKSSIPSILSTSSDTTLVNEVHHRHSDDTHKQQVNETDTDTYDDSNDTCSFFSFLNDIIDSYHVGDESEVIMEEDRNVDHKSLVGSSPTVSDAYFPMPLSSRLSVMHPCGEYQFSIENLHDLVITPIKNSLNGYYSSTRIKKNCLGGKRLILLTYRKLVEDQQDAFNEFINDLKNDRKYGIHCLQVRPLSVRKYHPMKVFRKYTSRLPKASRTLCIVPYAFSGIWMYDAFATFMNEKRQKKFERECEAKASSSDFVHITIHFIPE